MRVFYPQKFLRKMPKIMERKESVLVEFGHIIRGDDPQDGRFNYLGFIFLALLLIGVPFLLF